MMSNPCGCAPGWHTYGDTCVPPDPKPPLDGLFVKRSRRYVETCIIGMLYLAHKRKLSEVETGEYIMAELIDYGVMDLAPDGDCTRDICPGCPRCAAHD